jgi:hypothetical protein
VDAVSGPKLTVKGLAQQIDRLVGRAFSTVAVEGELAQVQVPQSGHAYLTLREQDAVLHVVMWRTEWAARAVDPRPGERVVVYGRVGTFPAQGRWQVYATRVERAGVGELQRRLEEIRARLLADGLLDPRRKRELPRFPRVVGVATSLQGAALQDFLRVSRERWPAAKILVAGCLVQGEEAAASVVRALELLFEDGRSDVVVVTRGGGSRLDLLPFDDEQLARWIATAPGAGRVGGRARGRHHRGRLGRRSRGAHAVGGGAGGAAGSGGSRRARGRARGGGGAEDPRRAGSAPGSAARPVGSAAAPGPAARRPARSAPGARAAAARGDVEGGGARPLAGVGPVVAPGRAVALRGAGARLRRGDRTGRRGAVAP